MKKRMIITLLYLMPLMSMVSGRALAQAADIEQLSLDIEKLAQFKQILSQMQKGYDLINSGYTTISGISQGTFNLHNAFLGGLMAVSPQVRNYSRVAEIIKYQELILSEYKSAYSTFQHSGRFTPGELNYLSTVYKNLFNQSISNLNELTMVITASQLRMSDDERIKNIDRIDRDMGDKLSFLRSFNSRASAVAAQRAREQQDASSMQQLYGR